MGTFGNHAFSDLGRQEHVGCQAVAGRMDIVGQENTGGQEDLREDCGRHCCPDIWLHHRGRIGANRGWIALYCDGVEKRGGGGLTKGQSAETICLNFKYKKSHYPVGICEHNTTPQVTSRVVYVNILCSINTVIMMTCMSASLKEKKSEPSVSLSCI